MPCKACQAETIRIRSGEVALHIPGLDGLDMPIVWVFPKVTICLSCGVAEFHIPERELQLLQDNEEGCSLRCMLRSRDLHPRQR